MDFEDYKNVHDLLGPWFASGDVDALYERLKDTDSNDKKAMKQLIEQDLVPSYRGVGQAPHLNLGMHQARVKAGLRFALQASDERLDQCWEGMLPAFDLPNNPRDLFVWIRDVFEAHQIFLTN